MATIHAALQSVVKYFNPSKAVRHTDDSRISAIQYKGVFGVLVTCAILSGLQSWFSRIDCSKPDSSDFDKKYAEEWCYANSTFLVEDADGGLDIGNPHSRTVVGQFFLRYYQWVTLALVLQAACFQAPRLLWKFAERGRVRKMVDRVANLEFASAQERTEAVKSLAKYYLDEDRRESHQNYFLCFASCQLLYLINVIVQISFTQAFLHDAFLGMFPLWLQGSPSWNRVFPKRAQCSLVISGAAGNTQRQDVLCLLSMNVLFEKMYVLIWLVFAVALVSAIVQNLLVGMTIMSGSETSKDGKGKQYAQNLSDRLLLSFLEQSLDRAVYQELLREIDPEVRVARV
ncbi:innexin inx3 [Galendromus occidentalis]|uniref:Innexin n=1 Tax=Galendromus occidentalis TaxID=34638 RepID=A0AAJ6VWI9_9ACAR|nr:innexin inx3 [Galendromus occidentalis]